MSLHCSAAEFEGIAGLLADDIKVESAGALADWWSVLKWPVSKGNSSRETRSYLPLTPHPLPRPLATAQRVPALGGVDFACFVASSIKNISTTNERQLTSCG